MSRGGLKHGSPPWDVELQVYFRYLCRYRYRGYLVTLTEGSLHRNRKKGLCEGREKQCTNGPGKQWFSEHRDCLCCWPPQQAFTAFLRKRLRDQRGLPTQEATWPASQGGSQWKIWDGNLARRQRGLHHREEASERSETEIKLSYLYLFLKARSVDQWH